MEVNTQTHIMKLKITLLAALVAGSQAQAVVIAQYDMADLAIVSGQMSSTSDVAGNADVTAGGFVENLTGGTAQGEFGTTGSLVPAGTNGFGARSLNSDPSDPWWEFTITPMGGATLALTTMTLDAGFNTTLSNSDWDYNVSWDVDGHASVLGVFDGPAGSMTSATSTGLSIDLSALAAQNSAFTIRVTPDRVSGTNGALSQRAGWIDNVTLNADVTPLPEPSSTMLLGLGGLALMLRRRR